MADNNPANSIDLLKLNLRFIVLFFKVLVIGIKLPLSQVSDLGLLVCNTNM